MFRYRLALGKILSAGALTVTVSAFVGLAAQAAANNDQYACIKGKPQVDDQGNGYKAEAVIVGCTHIIGNQNESAQKRAYAYYIRGNVYANKGDLERAIANYTEAIKLDPEDASIYDARGNIYSRKGDFDGAVADYSKIIQLKPGEAAAFVGRGLAYSRAGDFDRAIVDFSKAIEFHPKNFSAYTNRGHVYSEKGDFDRAIADYTEAIDIYEFGFVEMLLDTDPDPFYYYLRGLAYRDKGDTDPAIADLKKAAELGYAEAGEQLRKLGNGSVANAKVHKDDPDTNTNCQLIFSNVDPEAFEQSAGDLRNCRAAIVERASQGDVSSLILKSQLALRGIGEKASRRNARISLEAASVQKSALAKRLLAELLVNKLGADGDDYLEAEVLYIEAARLGDAKANSKLARLYAGGKIPNKSAADAQALFESAGNGDADAKLERAKILLSEAVRSGQEAPTTLAQVSSLLLEASRLGNPEASFLFAMLNLNNEGYSDSDIGKPELHAMLCRSADQGHAPAMHECAKHHFSQGEVPKAVAYLETAAERKHVESIEFLAEHISKTDFGSAKRLWFQAATLGSDAAKLALIYRFDSLTRDEQLNVNGAFADPAAFTTDLGRVMLGNHYLSIVEKGRAGEYVKGEYWYYENAIRAFSMASNARNKELADQARQVAHELRSQQDAYEKGLQNRRFQRKAEFWVGLAAVTYKVLRLSGNNGATTDLQMQEYENRLEQLRREQNLDMHIAGACIGGC